MYIETMQQILANTTKVLTDAKNGSNLMYLPLDKLISQTGGNSDGGAKVNVAPTSAAPGNGGQSVADLSQEIDLQRQRDARSRESRDRETR